MVDKSGKVTLCEITEATVGDVCRLAVSEAQTKFVAPNSVSIAQAHFSKYAWFRAVCVNDTPVGFAMLDDQPDKAEYYLWRFMIDSKYQGMGFGRSALKLLISHVKTRPNAAEFLLGVVPGEGSPQAFYEQMGFELTGKIEDGESEMRLSL
jgi:diamine N-acetyltransferase